MNEQMRGIRTKYFTKHGVSSVIINRNSNLLRLCCLRGIRLSNNIKELYKAMAMHFDHMFIGCLDTKTSSLGKELEAKHLKELVLLHLDLIQQQAEDLAERDKIIKELKQENENLRLQLEHSNSVANTATSLKCSIKEEYEQDICSDVSSTTAAAAAATIASIVVTSNNNIVVASIANKTSCLNISSEENNTVSRIQQSQAPRSQNKSDDLISDNSSGTTKSRDVSPSSRVLRNVSSSPILKGAIKDEVLNIRLSGLDSVSPLRHSPRLDCNNSNNSSCLDAIKQDTDSTNPSSNQVLSNSNNNNKCDDPSTPNRNSQPSDIDSEFGSNSPKLGSLRRYPGKSNPKKCLLKERRTRSDTHQSEHETSDTENDLDNSTQSNSQSSTPTKQLNYSPNNTFNKRKFEACEDEQDNKRSKRLTLDNNNINNRSSLSLNNRTVDSDTETTTNHSLRSRGDTSTLSPLETSLNKTDIDLEQRSCRKHNSSTSLSDELSSNCTTGAASDVSEQQVSAQEHERVFVKSAIDASTKLRENNAKVPRCSVRAVRSAEGLLHTKQPYFLPTEPPFDLTEPTDGPTDFTSLKQVEIPQWRVSVLTSLYVMEGTENLEDEVFTKRHAKLEQDEKRRKRWDLQRLREQRQYEKLRERYEVRNSSSSSNTASAAAASNATTTAGADAGELTPCSNPLCSHQHSSAAASTSGAACAGSSASTNAGVCVSSSGGGGGVGGGSGKAGGTALGAAGSDLVSLWPDPENALYLEIVDEIPVCAFGQPCAVTPSSEFSLPWLSSSAVAAAGSGSVGEIISARRRKR